MGGSTPLNKRDIIVNGWHLAQQGGITRYFYAILKEIDKNIDFAKRIEIIVPAGCNLSCFNNFQITVLPYIKVKYAVFWDFFRAKIYVKKKATEVVYKYGSKFNDI